MNTTFLNIARNILQNTKDKKKAEGNLGYVLTADDIKNAVKKAADLGIYQNAITIEMILEAESELRSSFTFDGGDFDILVDDKDHEPWLTTELKTASKWELWNRYKQYMLENQKMPSTVVHKLDDLTDEILGRIENPQRAGNWSVRGLVVGSVQSGKTANYVGLINKAIDSGYKLIIVMAGVHSTLRSQTQRRIDETVRGMDTRENSVNTIFGVGKISQIKETVHMLTSEKHDFNKNRAASLGVLIGGNPVILVVKKNPKILENLQTWILGGSNVKLKSGESEGGACWVPDCPALLIDDEADNASINVRANGRSPINDAIVGLLNSFQKIAYVGYTATPYANLFIDTDDAENLYPRNFIINIRPPANYLGVERVFGVQADDEVGVTGRDPMPIVEAIDKDTKDKEPPAYLKFIPQKHPKDFTPTDLPPCLKKAIKVFILATAAKNLRMSKGVRLQKHSSMLVHVSHFKLVIDKFADLIRAYRDKIKEAELCSDDAILNDFESTWKSEFESKFPDFEESDRGITVSWDEIKPLLRSTIKSIQVRAIRGENQVSLDYDLCEAEGLVVIAVGGNKLSRGLTLESLVVSYYLRTTKMYDTLMQMGRWFGYRDGYIDLCRVYTSKQLIKWYSHIALADHELRRDFERLCESGSKPSEYGMRVRAHPDGMRITALSRMRTGKSCHMTFAGKLVQTTILSTDETNISENFNNTLTFLLSLGEHRSVPDAPSYKYYAGVKSEVICDYISKVNIPSGSSRFVKTLLTSFINKQVSYAKNWNVVFAPLAASSSPAAKGVNFDFNGQTLKAVGRKVEALGSPRPISDLGIEFTPVRYNLLDPSDQSADLHFIKLDEALINEYSDKNGLDEYIDNIRGYLTENLNLYQVALRLTQLKGPNKKGQMPATPSGELCRLLRPEGQALLLIYPVTPLLDDSTKYNLNSSGKKIYETVASNLTKPLIGLALSFSASDKVVPVEYMIDEELQRRIFGEDLDADWASEEEEATTE